MANTEESNVASIGHNSKTQAEAIRKAAEIFLNEVDPLRKQANKAAQKARDILKEAGLETDAFRDEFAYFKKRKHDKDGYDESRKLCFEVLNKAENRDLFDDAQANEKQDKKAEKDAKKLEEKRASK